MQAELFRESFAVERKVIEVTLHENEGGKFARLREDTGGHKSVIIVPADGLSKLAEVLLRADRASR